mmetsp:Transcript_163607/g.524582  ORF Transcript_163607/g.524582 Transcript_163607/m.524582 type:complete len:225 (-) Transcript_163607:1006-1680(-)
MGEDPVVFQHGVKLFLRKLIRTIRVHSFEDPLHDVVQLRLPVQLLLHRDGAIVLRSLDCRIHEDARQDVEHSKDHEADVKHPQRAVDPTRLGKRRREEGPISAAGDRFEQRQASLAHAPIQLLELGHMTRAFDEVEGVQAPIWALCVELLAGVRNEFLDIRFHALQHQDAEDVHDDEHQQEGPEQGHDARGQGDHHLLKPMEEPQEAHRPHDLAQAGDAENLPR